MTPWLLAIAGWSAAFCFRGVLGISRRRVAKLQEKLAASQYDLAFATEKLTEFIDRANRAEDEVMRLQGKIRAAELEESARRRRVN